MEELALFCANANTIPPDALATHLTQALVSLSEITGEITTEDIVNAVFSSFCVGK